MQRSFTPPFEQNLREFIERKIPCELFTLWYPRRGVDRAFDTWFEEIIKKEGLLACLRDLHKRGIRPAPVLAILGQTQQLFSTQPKPLKRDSRQRIADSKAIDNALEIMENYPGWALCLSGLLAKEEMEHARTARNYLRALKHAIEMIRPKKQPDVEMRFCAQTLADFFRSVTPDNSPFQHVGELMNFAFPDEWAAGREHVKGGVREPANLRLAAFMRAKGPSINARRSTLQEAIDLQNGNYRFWRERKELIKSWRTSKEGIASAKAMKRRAKLAYEANRAEKITTAR